MTKKKAIIMSFESVRRLLQLRYYGPTAWLTLVALSCVASDVAAHGGPEQDIEEIVVTGRWMDLAGTPK